jgi:DNA-binding SARP family transcriptional activator/tetratricopeptide (TPR) repeat protein
LIRLYLFGAPRLERDGLAATTDTKKAIALLAYLAVTGRGHTRDTLAALLWGDADQQHARGALRRTLSVLRAAGGSDVVETAGDTVSAGKELWCDVVAFRAGLKAGAPERGGMLELASAPFMSGFSLRDAPDFEEWQFLEGEALNRELAEALAREAGQLLERGELGQALTPARRLLALDPLNEEAHRLLMRLHAFNGDQTAALRQYRECARVLEQELGVPPLSETTELYHAIRENRLARPAAVAHRIASGSPEAGLENARAAEPLTLVGRAREWSTLVRAYEREAAEGYCAALEGEAGIGKTRLAEELIAFARARGAGVAVARCYEGEAGLAYGAVMSLLRRLLEEADCADRLAALPALARAETARLLPELAPVEAATAQLAVDPGAQARFFEGLAQFLTGLCPRGQPTVLFFDDLHWADEASLDFLAYFARRLAGRALCLVLSWRSDGSMQVERLRLLLAELGRSGRGVLLPLPRLSQADVRALAEAAQRDELAARIYRESEGVPLFVAAYLDAAQSGELQSALPATVRDLLSARLAAVSDAQRQLLQAAAVLGRSFDLDVLQATSGRSADETLTGVEQLIARGLLREAAGQRNDAAYDFDHDKLRELTYEALGAGRRRLLHERAARAWLALSERGHGSEPVAAIAARHLERAGRDEAAAEQHVAAARQAERVYANADAVAHYRAALALGYGQPSELCEAIADLEALRGDYLSAQSAYELAAAQLPEGAQTGRVELKLANLHARLGDWDAADGYYRTAEQALRGAEDGARAALYADWALTAHQRGEGRRAGELADRALLAATATGDIRSLAQAHNVMGVLRRKAGDLAGAVDHLEQARVYAAQLGDPRAGAAALNNLALALAESGEPVRAEQLLRAALAEATRQGDRHREAALRNNLADLLHGQGREEDAMAELKLAVALFAEVGAQAGERRAEIWKLAEW